MGFSAYGASTIGQLQANMLYGFQNFQNSELNALPVSDLYFLLLNQPRQSDGGDGGLGDMKELKRTMESGFREAMSV